MKESDNIKLLLNRFAAIGLQEMDRVRLLNRSEKKYVLHLNKVIDVLEILIPDYQVLEINEQRLLEYNTEYFDTLDNAMYLAHHNGKQSRFKVRRREYVVSGEQFLEVKRRSQNGMVSKKRVEISDDSIDSAIEHDFIESATPYKLDGLEMKLINSFQRITLVSIARKERITIDIGLEFKNKSRIVELPQVAIIEYKFDKSNMVQGFDELMQKFYIEGSSLSKYCIGRALLEPKLKSNLFQDKIRFLTKLNSAIKFRRTNQGID